LQEKINSPRTAAAPIAALSKLSFTESGSFGLQVMSASAPSGTTRLFSVTPLKVT
jgi:hypothetical protein